MELIILLSILVIVAVAALNWGNDSRDDVDSQEWIRRHNYQSHHL